MSADNWGTSSGSKSARVLAPRLSDLTPVSGASASEAAARLHRQPRELDPLDAGGRGRSLDQAATWVPPKALNALHSHATTAWSLTRLHRGAYASLVMEELGARPIQSPIEPPVLQESQRLYLELLRGTLTRFVTRGEAYNWGSGRLRRAASTLVSMLQAAFGSSGLRVIQSAGFDASLRREGRDWPIDAETMIGLKRLENLEAIAVEVLRRGIPGDFVETGAWRGGAAIFMKGVLQALEDQSRCVWVCDSFQGLPKPDEGKYPADAGDQHWRYPFLAVSQDAVRSNFERYGLLDERVRFVAGWFEESLPRAPIREIALLRLDGDMYSSTWEALAALYPKVSEGGFVVVDDYGAIPACRAAVETYRREQGIKEPLHPIDWTGVFWRRSGLGS